MLLCLSSLHLFTESRMSTPDMLCWLMPDRNSSSPDSDHLGVSFRRGVARPLPPATVPVEDPAKYERDEESDDYEHPMIGNIMAFIFVVALIRPGVWLADTIA